MQKHVFTQFHYQLWREKYSLTVEFSTQCFFYQKFYHEIVNQYYTFKNILHCTLITFAALLFSEQHHSIRQRPYEWILLTMKGCVRSINILIRFMSTIWVDIHKIWNFILIHIYFEDFVVRFETIFDLIFCVLIFSIL